MLVCTPPAVSTAPEGNMSPSNVRADTSHLNRSTQALLETPKRGGSNWWLTTVPTAVASAVEREGTQAYADPGGTARASAGSASYVSGVAAANASRGFTVTKEQVHRVDSQPKSIQAESKTRRILSEREQTISDEQITGSRSSGTVHLTDVLSSATARSPLWSSSPMARFKGLYPFLGIAMCCALCCHMMPGAVPPPGAIAGPGGVAAPAAAAGRMIKSIL